MISVPATASGSRVVRRKRETLAMLGQRFAAKTERRDRREIGRRADLARRVPLQAKQRVVAVHPAAVIDHADERNAAAPDDHLDLARAGVDAVLDQLLHHRRRPLDHFARRHLAGEDFRKAGECGSSDFRI